MAESQWTRWEFLELSLAGAGVMPALPRSVAKGQEEEQ
jgi:hypothetical protein